MDTKKDKVTRFLHWGFAYFVLTMLALGFTMTNTEFSPNLYYLHKSLGVIFSVLIGFRLYWRITQPWQSSTAHKKNSLVHYTHTILVILLCMMPITGLLNSGFSGFSVHLFDFVIVPENINAAGNNEPFNATIYETAKLVHKLLAYFFTMLIFLHIIAALKHHFIEKDNTLRKMFLGK